MADLGVGVLGIAVLVVAGLGFVWLGPVQVGNKKALFDFLLGRGIEAPTAERALAQLGPVPEQESKGTQLMLAESGQVGLMFLLLELVTC
jgi:hypothetical protein